MIYNSDKQTFSHSRQRLTWMVVAAILCTFSCITIPASAQDDVEAARKVFSQRTYPWYDAESDELRSMDFSARATPNSVDRNEIRQGSPLQPGTSGGAKAATTVNSGLSTIAWIALALLIGTVAGLLIWAFFKIESETNSHRSLAGKRSRAESIEHLPFQLNQHAGDFRELAQQAYAAGDFRAAVIFLFSHVLVTLDQSQLIRLRKGKTNRQYLLELKSYASLASFYQQVMERFESVFFGDHELTKSEFESTWQALGGFETGVSQSSGLAS